MMNVLHTCRICGAEKQKTEFTSEKRNTNGITSRCKACRCEARRNSGDYNRERLRKFSIRHNSQVNITVDELEILLRKRDCTYCGVEMNGISGSPHEATIDHVYPGANIAADLVVACRRCNSAKRQSHVYDFYQSSEKFTDALWNDFVRDFTSKLVGRGLTDQEVEQMKQNFADEARELRKYVE
jgi:hypothetical protein